MMFFYNSNIRADSEHLDTRAAHLSDLHAPVEEVLGPDAVLVLSDVIEQAAVRHELSDQLHRGGQTDSQQAAHVRTDHTRHHVRLLCEKKQPRVGITTLLSSRVTQVTGSNVLDI